MVRGAPKNKPPEDDVEGLFDRARQAGATAGPAPDQAPAGGTAAFSGAAHTLAGGAVPAQAQAAAGPPPPITHTIAFYANGVFTVDDGARLRCASVLIMIVLLATRLPLRFASTQSLPKTLASWHMSTLFGSTALLKADKGQEAGGKDRI